MDKTLPTSQSETPETDERRHTIDTVIGMEDRRQAAERRVEREGWVTGGWRYRDKKTGIVILTEQPPDRVIDLARYEVTELFARNPMLSAPRKDDNEAA